MKSNIWHSPDHVSDGFIREVVMLAGMHKIICAPLKKSAPFSTVGGLIKEAEELKSQEIWTRVLAPLYPPPLHPLPAGCVTLG